MISGRAFIPHSIWVIVVGSLLLVTARSFAVDSQPVRVTDVLSGTHLVVESQIGGLPADIILQLTGIKLIGPPECAAQRLRELCPPGTQVIIRTDGYRLDHSRLGAIPAWVMRNFARPVDPAAPVPDAGDQETGSVLSAIQSELVRSGWAVPVRVDVPTALPAAAEASLRGALREALNRRLGAYSLPGADELWDRMKRSLDDPTATSSEPAPAPAVPIDDAAANDF